MNQHKRSTGAGVAFLGCGLAYLGVGLGTRNPVFYSMAPGFIALGIVFLVRARRATPCVD